MGKVTLVRHAKSKANVGAIEFEGKNTEEIALANRGAQLTEEGIEQCIDLRVHLGKLTTDSLEVIEVSASEFERTQETARRVGFQAITVNPLLNESNEALPMVLLEQRLLEGWLPADTLGRAESFLSDADQHHEFHFSHGLFIASCRYVAGQRPESGNMRELVPRTAEAVEIEI